MTVLEDLPLEILDKIFSKLDKNSIKAASTVCVSWRKIVHDFTSPYNCDTALKDKLEKCGWNISEHDVENCKCIELKSDLFKFIGNVFLPCKEPFLQNSLKRDFSRCTVSKNKIFMSKRDRISVMDLALEKAELTSLPIKSKSGVGKVNSAIHVQDRTLVTCMVDYKGYRVLGDDLKSLEIVIFNLATLKTVSDSSIIDTKMLIGFTHEFVRARFSVVATALAKDKLAVNLKIMTETSVCYQTLLWRLDTEDPSMENIRHWKTLVHDLIANDEEYKFKMVMNSKLLSIAVEFCTHYKVMLNVFHFENLECQTTTVIPEYHKGVCEYDIMIESGFSSKIAVFDKKINIVTVYKFDTASDNSCSYLEIDLNSISKNVGLEFWSLTNFVMGKLILILVSDFTVQCILVSEDGYVIEGNKQKIHDRAVFFHVDAIGIVALQSKFLM